MSTIRIKCLSCGKTLEADEAWIGTELPCPNCKANILIQKEEPKPQLRVVDEEEDEKEDTASIDFNAVPKDIEEATVFLCEALKANEPLERIIELVETYHADAQNNLCYVQSPVVLSYLLAHGAGTLLGEEDCKSLINSYIGGVRYPADAVHSAEEINQCTSLLEILLKLPQCKKTWIQESLICFGDYPVDFQLMSWFINTYMPLNRPKLTKEELLSVGIFFRDSFRRYLCLKTKDLSEQIRQLNKIRQLIQLPDFCIWVDSVLTIDATGRDIWYDFINRMRYSVDNIGQQDFLIKAYDIIITFYDKTHKPISDNQNDSNTVCLDLTFLPSIYSLHNSEFDCCGNPKVPFFSCLFPSREEEIAYKKAGIKTKQILLSRLGITEDIFGALLNIGFFVFSLYLLFASFAIQGLAGSIVCFVAFVVIIWMSISYIKSRNAAKRRSILQVRQAVIATYGYWNMYVADRKRTRPDDDGVF